MTTGYALRIDGDLCTGYGVCILEAPGQLELDDDGVVVEVEGAPAASLAVLQAAARACPMGAITVVDPAGRRAA